MRLPKLDFLRILTYPNILNPFVWIILFLYTISMIFVSWWKIIKKDDRRHYLVLQTRSDFSYRLRDYLSFWIIIFTNTFLRNKILADKYADLYTYHILPYYKKDDWRYKQKIDEIKRQIKLIKNKGI